jgi:hypothetical protein
MKENKHTVEIRNAAFPQQSIPIDNCEVNNIPPATTTICYRVATGWFPQVFCLRHPVLCPTCQQSNRHTKAAKPSVGVPHKQWSTVSGTCLPVHTNGICQKWYNLLEEIH